jgi:hypothetical protein
MMKSQKVVEAANEYRTMLETRGLVAERVSDRYLERLLDSGNGEDREVLLRHALWICCHIPAIIGRPAGHNFCLRWIGCVEGILIGYRIVSVEQVREKFRTSGFLRAMDDELDALPSRVDPL